MPFGNDMLSAVLITIDGLPAERALKRMVKVLGFLLETPATSLARRRFVEFKPERAFAEPRSNALEVPG